ncbi:hypothetical protein BOO86_09850 [Mycobacterium sp. CBMA 234]|nr:hypothetical protein [Mycolicibacterium sp. CBMA 234]
MGIGSGSASASPATDPGMVPMDHGWGGGGDWDDHHGWGHGGWGHGGWGGGDDQGWGGPGWGWPPPCLTVPYVSICA